MRYRILAFILIAVLCISPAAASAAEDDFRISEEEISDEESGLVLLPEERMEQDCSRDEIVSFEESETFLVIPSGSDTESDEETSKTWGSDLMNLTATKAAAQEAYEQGIIHDTVLIAVVDTGINTSHELFTDRISPLSRSFLNGRESSDFEDENGHGTNIAGIIAANTPENAQLLILQALDETNSGSAENIAEAIKYAVAQGADAINLSLSTSKNAVGNETLYNDYTARIDAALECASDARIPVFVSAGNDGADIEEIGAYPAGSEDVYTVSAISQDLEVYKKSNFGSSVDYCAPGENIYTAAIGSSDEYEYNSGTSMAAPFITASYVLIKLCYASRSNDDVREILQMQAHSDVISSALFQNGLGCPILDIVYEEPVELPVLKISEFIEDGEGNVELHWNEQEGVSYRVYRKIMGMDKDFVLMDTVTGGSYIDSALMYGFWKALYFVEAVETGNYLFDRSSQFQVFGYSGKRIRFKTDRESSFINSSYYYSARVGESFKIDVLYPSDYYDSLELEWSQEVNWNPESRNVVSVDAEGNIEALSSGTAWIDIRVFDAENNTYWTLAYLVIQVSDSKCGENLSWEITEEGEDVILTISGTGDMYDFADEWNSFYEWSEDPRPWADRIDEITKLVIEDGVTSIGNFAFFNAVSLKSVEGMKDIYLIGKNSFCFCSQLQTIDEMPYLSTILSEAFMYCSSLFEFPFSEGLKYIEGGSFWECNSLHEIRIPEGIENIDWNAFARARADVMILPSSIDTEEKMLRIIYNSSAKSFQVNENNPVFFSADGVIYSWDKKTLYAYPKGADAETFVVPDSVGQFGQYAFDHCLYLKEVVLPDGFSKIPAEAFSWCTKLEKITIPDSVEIIDERAFEYCSSLKEVLLSTESRLIRIEQDAFYETALEHFDCPAGVEYLGARAFEFSKLTSFVIPEGMTEFYVSVFDGCPLHSISLPSSLVKVDGPYDNSSYDQLTEVTYKGFTSQYKKIDFAQCVKDAFLSAELHISISGSCGNNLTWKAEGLSRDLTLTISGSGGMDDFTPAESPWAAGRDEIKRIIVEDGVIYIGSFAFYQMTALQSIQIPAAITGYGTGALNGTAASEGIVYVPDGEALESFSVIPQYLEAVYQEIDEVPVSYEPQIRVEKNTEEGTISFENFTVQYENMTNPGEGNIRVTIREEEREPATLLLPFTVHSKDFEGVQINNISSLILSAASFVYNGQIHKPNVTVKSGAYPLKYNVDYTLTYSPVSVINAGTYRVTAVGKGAYLGSSLSRTFTITRKPLTGASVSGILAKTYTGNKITQKPTITLSGRTLKSCTDYKITYSNNTNVGTATMVITGLGNYSGTIRKSFKISAAAISKATVSGISKKVYTGSAIKPVPTVKYNSVTLKNGIHYTLTYKNNTNVGTATVVITGKGNFTRTVKKTFVINPKAVSISSLKPGAKQLTVNWKKAAGVITGYQIQYSTSSGFSSAKTVSVSASVSTKVIKNLTAKKTYYVRIRAYKTVSGQKYYSAWSTYRSAKTS